MRELSILAQPPTVVYRLLEDRLGAVGPVQFTWRGADLFANFAERQAQETVNHLSGLWRAAGGYRVNVYFAGGLHRGCPTEADLSR